VKKLWANTKMFKRELKKRGFQFKVSETPIIPIHVGDAARAFEFSKKLFEAGVFAPAVGYPLLRKEKRGYARSSVQRTNASSCCGRRTFCPKLRSHLASSRPAHMVLASRARPVNPSQYQPFSVVLAHPSFT